MKKISVLIALILCVTISGVYAAWLYTGDTVSIAERGLSHAVTTATNKGDMGVIKVVHNDVDIKIDQTAEGDYTANLIITGSITVSFTPNPGAPETVVKNAVPAQCTIILTDVDTNKYLESPIYKVSDTPSIDLVWTPAEDGTFTATVQAEQIADILTLGDTFVLDTHEEYVAFRDLELHTVITAQFAQK